MQHTVRMRFLFDPDRRSRCLMALSLLWLAGCQTLSSTRPEQYITMYQDFPPAVDRFQACQDVGCDQRTEIRLTSEQWRQVADVFSTPADDAQAERRQIAKAVAKLEQLVGPLAGTAGDQPMNTGGGLRQLDCIAETVNTTTYLLLIQQQGWLRHHDVIRPKHRGLAQLLGPHNTAAILDRAAGVEYVVDSWFHANGQPPEIVPHRQWHAGYEPVSIRR